MSARLRGTVIWTVRKSDCICSNVFYSVCKGSYCIHWIKHLFFWASHRNSVVLVKCPYMCSRFYWVYWVTFIACIGNIFLAYGIVKPTRWSNVRHCILTDIPHCYCDWFPLVSCSTDSAVMQTAFIIVLKITKFVDCIGRFLFIKGQNLRCWICLYPQV
jgi:hypothetical protein